MRKLMRDFILLKSNTCMRFGEIRNLTWGMVKIKNLVSFGVGVGSSLREQKVMHPIQTRIVLFFLTPSLTVHYLAIPITNTGEV